MSTASAAVTATAVVDGGAPPMLVRTRQELDVALAGLPGPRRFVPTMGALHAGHAALLERAGPGAVLSVFVNPLQFGAGEDLDRYPRTLEEDLKVAAAQRVSVVYAPNVEEMYPGGAPRITIRAGVLGEQYEGAARPGHFDGMLTVVAKLFAQVRPDVAYFGQKDAQQLALVRAMVADLDLGVRIEEVSTVREPDGLARSSRNRYLDPEQRQAALTIAAALRTRDRDAARAVLAAEPRLAVDYCDLVDPASFAPTEGPYGRLVIAAYAGTTRLIDNLLLDPDHTQEI